MKEKDENKKDLKNKKTEKKAIQKDIAKESKSSAKEVKKEETALQKVKKDKKEAEKESLWASISKNIKKRWLISGTNTILLILIMIAVFIFVNLAVYKADFTALDCTVYQNYTLTDESKERVADISDEVNMYFVGWDESDSTYTLAKQYNKANENINVEIIDASENIEFAEAYDVSNDDYAIIVESGELSTTLSSSDLYTYDSDYNTIDISEQKLTSAILNVTSGETPKLYYLTGYSDLTFDLDYYYGYSLYYFAQYYLEDEVLEYDTLNLLTAGDVPDDCDVLMIVTPTSDFDEIVADAIIDYINNGGNIIWLNGIKTDDTELTNVNRVLSEYGVEGFDIGYVYETDENSYVGYQFCFIPSVQSTDITSDIYDGKGLYFLYSSKLNIDEDALEDLNVEETDLVLSSSTSYFTTDLTGETDTSSDTQGEFVLASLMEKTVSEGSDDDEEDEDDETDEESEDEDAIISNLVIIANDYFISDTTLQSGLNPMVMLGNNADLVLNTVAYMTENYDDITLRKSYSSSTTSLDTVTDGENATIMAIIFTVPIAIIAFGIVVWVIRKNKK